MKLRILLIHNRYKQTGGEEIYVNLLKDILIKNDHEVKEIIIENNIWNTFNILKKIIILLKNILFINWNENIKDTIKIFKPDIIHINNVYPLLTPNIYLLCSTFRIPIVQSVHNYRQFCFNGLMINSKGKHCQKCRNGNFFNGILGKCYQESYLKSIYMFIIYTLHFYRKTYNKFINCFIYPSRFAQKLINPKNSDSKKIYCLPNFIGVSHSISNTSANKNILYLGRLSKEKGILTLLKTFEKYKENLSRIRLCIAGNGPLENDIIHFIKHSSLNNITLLGYVNKQQKWQYFAQALCVVFPSECLENYPYAIVESFACGTPVVASDIGAVREMIEESNGGILFEPGNVDDLYSKINTLSNNNKLHDTLSENARKYYTTHCNDDENYKKLIKIYDIAINNKRV